jgi:hypothetical protein
VRESRPVLSKVRFVDSILSGAARCRVGGAATLHRSCASSQGTRHDGRRLGSFLHPLSGGRIAPAPPFGGGRWDDPGLAGESDTPRIKIGAWGGSCRSAWNRNGGACGRQWTSEDGTISVKAPPAVARDDQARGVSIQNAERRCRAGSSGMVPVGSRVYRGNRVHRSRIGRSGRKRIAALILPGSGRANGSGPGEAPAPERRSRWKNARERAPRSPCQTQTMGI